MKKLTYLLMACLCMTLWSCGEESNETPSMDVTTSFEGRLSGSEESFLGTEGETEGYYQKTEFKDNDGLIICNHYFASWGFGGGFTYTNTTDTETPGFNNLSAITARGKFGTTYLTSCSNSFNTAKITLADPAKYAFKGAWVTNTTYDYLAIKDGNDGSGTVQGPFEAGDWFKLTAVGHRADESEVGRVDYYLADFRDGKQIIVNTWEWFDWSALKDAAYITFELSSSDNGDYGMNTPAYFSLDGVTLTQK